MLEKLQAAATELAQRTPTPMNDLSLNALQSQVDELQLQLSEYKHLRSGSASPLVVSRLEELPRDLIRARLAQGLTQRQLAEKLKLKEQQIQRYEASEYSGASVSRMLSIAEALGLDVAQDKGSTEPAEAPMLGTEIDWSKFPIREMYVRGWFHGFQGSLHAARQNADELLRDYIGAFFRRPTLALHRKRIRSGSKVDEYALLAWECRVLDLASSVQLETNYSRDLVTRDWIENLVRTSRFDDAPVRAVAMLASIGIPLVFEPQLPGTHLDGAALLSGETPVIGLTLRHDRIDNFWFVLLHELFHALEHLRKGGLAGTFDDLDAPDDNDLEREADALAGEALLPDAKWRRAVARFVRTDDAVLEFAQEIDRHPAIVAGRIRHEANNYVILRDLVGAGQVRKLVLDARSGP
ncbi:MAG: ImmA/IrrE family metallo-endopeptidase [Thioalkalivibrio sp.]|nr:ImmA/IrrE family metallo-endopeptidase [Thioalkalivibrio sp.]